MGLGFLHAKGSLEVALPPTSSKEFWSLRILATLRQGNKSMYSNTPGYVHLYVKSSQSITEIWTVFPPEGTRIGLRGRPESPCTSSYMRSSLDQYLSTDSSV